MGIDLNQMDVEGVAFLEIPCHHRLLSLDPLLP